MPWDISKGEDMKTDIIENFVELLGIKWQPEEKQVEVLCQLVDYSKTKGKSKTKDYRITFIEAVNNKLDLNASAYQDVLDYAFKIHVKFHYKQKLVIRELLDSGNTDAFSKFLKENNIEDNSFIEHFNPVDEDITIRELENLIQTDQKCNDVIASIFSPAHCNLSCTHPRTPSATDLIMSKYPVKILTRPLNAISQLPVNTPVMKSIMPLNICVTSSNIGAMIVINPLYNSVTKAVTLGLVTHSSSPNSCIVTLFFSEISIIA